MAFGDERSPERVEIGFQHLQAAGIVSCQRGCSLDNVQCGPFLRAGLRERQRAGGKVEGGEAELARDFGAVWLPMETAGDHQVEHREEVALEADHDALAEALQALHPAAEQARQRRLDRAHQERTAQAYRLQGLAEDALA